MVSSKSTYSPFVLDKGASGSMLSFRAPGSATVATLDPTTSLAPFTEFGVV